MSDLLLLETGAPDNLLLETGAPDELLLETASGGGGGSTPIPVVVQHMTQQGMA